MVIRANMVHVVIVPNFDNVCPLDMLRLKYYIIDKNN